MGVFSEIDMDFQAIQQAMEPTPTERSQIYVERTVTSIINDLDQLCAFAADPATAGFIEAEKIATATRIQLLQSLLLARRAPTLRTIHHA
jgi:hypothetical protein